MYCINKYIIITMINFDNIKYKVNKIYKNELKY